MGHIILFYSRLFDHMIMFVCVCLQSQDDGYVVTESPPAAVKGPAAGDGNGHNEV